MLNRVSTFKRGSHLRDRPVHMAENPEYPRPEGQHGHSSILAGCPSSHLVGVLTCVEYLDSAIDRLAGLDDASQEKKNHCSPACRVD